MYSIKTSKNRRFIGEFTRGTDLGKALEKLLKDNEIRTGSISITGQLSQVKLLINSEKKILAGSVSVTANIQLVSCTGIITERDGKFDPMLYAVCSYPSELGWITTGGVIDEAKVLVCDFILDAFDDVLIRKALEPKLEIHTWNETFIADSEDEDQQTTSSFKSIPVTSEPDKTDSDDDDEDDDYDEIIPEVGDIINHFTFGRCVVEKINEDNDTMVVMLPTKRTARLGMSVLHFELEGTENNRKIFKAYTDRHR